MKRRLPSLNALRAFEAAARLGRMTAAADELSVTPGAISRQVRQLETSLGLRLFEGSKNKPLLTQQGSALLSGLSAAFDQMESTLRAVTEQAQGTVDVCCLGSFSMRWLIPRLYRFNALHPGIEVRLSTSKAQTQPSDERYDVVIDVQEQAAQAPSRELFAEYLGPVLAPALAATLVLDSAEDLAGLALLRTKTRRNAWTMWCDSQGMPTLEATGAEFEHYYFSLEAALGGLGVCVAPWHLVADEVRAGRLLAPFGFQRSGYRYVARSRPRHQHAESFCQWLMQQAEQMPLPPECSLTGS